jgi:hypothetical protein
VKQVDKEVVHDKFVSRSNRGGEKRLASAYWNFASKFVHDSKCSTNMCRIIGSAIGNVIGRTSGIWGITGIPTVSHRQMCMTSQSLIGFRVNLRRECSSKASSSLSSRRVWSILLRYRTCPMQSRRRLGDEATKMQCSRLV